MLKDSDVESGVALRVNKGSFLWTEANSCKDDDEEAKGVTNPAAVTDAVILPEKDGNDVVLETSCANSFKLDRINITVNEGELCAVIGKVGSGKSSLLSAILGEMEMVEGTVSLREAKLALVEQNPWIMSRYCIILREGSPRNWNLLTVCLRVECQLDATLRENIIFGLPFDKERYEKVIEACALHQDIAVLRGGDLVEIGEHGINISGGQKARVSLARAVCKCQHSRRKKVHRV